jgi:hypothetical protein
MSTSLPTPRPQPDAAIYSPDELRLFPRLTRAIHRQLFGEQAPPWDRNRRIQRWFDSSAADLPPDEPYVVEYWDLRPSGPIRRRLAITNREASSPNLPGQYDYPKYEPEPSGAYMDDLDSLGRPTGRKIYLPSVDLSHHADAVALTKELAAVPGITDVSAPYETVMTGPYAYRFEPHEIRRFWNLRLNGGEGAVSVGRALKLKYAMGVGAPGRWTYSNGGLNWVSEIPADVGEQDLRPEIPIPQRPLRTNERWNVSNPFTVPMVERTDKAETIETDDAKAMPKRIAEILARVKTIQDALNKEGS